MVRLALCDGSVPEERLKIAPRFIAGDGLKITDVAEFVPQGQLHPSPGPDKASFTSLVAALGSRPIRSHESQRDGPNPARTAHRITNRAGNRAPLV